MFYSSNIKRYGKSNFYNNIWWSSRKSRRYAKDRRKNFAITLKTKDIKLNKYLDDDDTYVLRVKKGLKEYIRLKTW